MPSTICDRHTHWIRITTTRGTFCARSVNDFDPIIVLTKRRSARSCFLIRDRWPFLNFRTLHRNIVPTARDRASGAAFGTIETCQRAPENACSSGEIGSDRRRAKTALWREACRIAHGLPSATPVRSVIQLANIGSSEYRIGVAFETESGD